MKGLPYAACAAVISGAILLGAHSAQASALPATPAGPSPYTTVLWAYPSYPNLKAPQPFVAAIDGASMTGFGNVLKCGQHYQVDVYTDHDAHGTPVSSLWSSGSLLYAHDGGFLAYGAGIGTPYKVIEGPACASTPTPTPSATATVPIPTGGPSSGSLTPSPTSSTSPRPSETPGPSLTPVNDPSTVPTSTPTTPSTGPTSTPRPGDTTPTPSAPTSQPSSSTPIVTSPQPSESPTKQPSPAPSTSAATTGATGSPNSTPSASASAGTSTPTAAATGSRTAVLASTGTEPWVKWGGLLGLVIVGLGAVLVGVEAAVNKHKKERR